MPPPARPRIDLRRLARGEPVEPLRVLLREYAAALGVDLGFQGFDAELAALPAGYEPPDGVFRIAEVDGTLAACGALRRWAGPRAGAPPVCELKRLFVRPAHRGHGLGRRLAEALLDDARRLGYVAARLDTLASMTEARRLYAALGFVEIAPYYPNPLPGTRYLERSLVEGGPAEAAGARA